VDLDDREPIYLRDFSRFDKNRFWRIGRLGLVQFFDGGGDGAGEMMRVFKKLCWKGPVFRRKMSLRAPDTRKITSVMTTPKNRPSFTLALGHSAGCVCEQVAERRIWDSA
jgi:hypothetical protein